MLFDDMLIHWFVVDAKIDYQNNMWIENNNRIYCYWLTHKSFIPQQNQNEVQKSQFERRKKKQEKKWTFLLSK